MGNRHRHNHHGGKGKPKAPASLPNGGAGQKQFPPYRFVSNSLAKQNSAEPVFHDTLHDDKFSGALLCELTTLTESIFAGFQQAIKPKREHNGKCSVANNMLPSDILNDMGKYWRECNESERTRKGEPPKSSLNKSILLPLQTDSDETLIAGSSLKGMLRHSFAALTSSPMHRVQEQSYSYRPSLANTTPRRILPARVLNTSPMQVCVYEISTYPNFQAEDIIFVSGDVIQFGKINEETGKRTSDVVLSEELKVSEHKNRLKKLKAGTELGGKLEPDEQQKKHSKKRAYYSHIHGKKPHLRESLKQDYMAFPYYGGNMKKLSKAKTYDVVLLSQKIYDRYENNIASIPDEVTELYHNTTLHLCDEVAGHLSPRNPDVKKELNIKSETDTIKNNRALRRNQLIFVEVEDVSAGDKKIISFGNNYQYRWGYKDTIHGIGISTGQYQDPAQLKVKRDGQATPTMLNLVNRLFGFVAVDESASSAQAANTNESDKLAGRISINHAIEQIDEDKPSVLSRDKYSCLPTTGSPKASAVEFYLQQQGKSLQTYGDSAFTASQSQLNGRKFYLHQSPTTHAKYAAMDNAAIAKGVVPEQTRYRFKLRFSALDDWELGLLITALNPNLVAQCLQSNNLPKKVSAQMRSTISWLNKHAQASFAQKLGYGKPQGFGSCSISIDKINLVNNPDQTSQNTTTEHLVMASLEKFASSNFDKVLLSWLKIHRFQTNVQYQYPTIDKRDDGKVFEFHSAVRKIQLQHRVGDTRDSISNAVLPPLND